MGDIWLCEDPSLCRHVVVKQMQASLRGWEDLMKRSNANPCSWCLHHRTSCILRPVAGTEPDARARDGIVEGQDLSAKFSMRKSSPAPVVLYLPARNSPGANASTATTSFTAT